MDSDFRIAPKDPNPRPILMNPDVFQRDVPHQGPSGPCTRPEPTHPGSRSTFKDLATIPVHTDPTSGLLQWNQDSGPLQVIQALGWPLWIQVPKPHTCWFRHQSSLPKKFSSNHRNEPYQSAHQESLNELTGKGLYLSNPVFKDWNRCLLLQMWNHQHKAIRIMNNMTNETK